MDQRTLDTIARHAATGSSRRTIAGAIVGLLAGGWFGLRPESAAAVCKKVNQNCDRNSDCCAHAHCPTNKCRCRNGFSNCNNECFDLDTDERNCGACGTRCNGLCQGLPGTPLDCFDGCCSDGACVDTRTDRNNCRTCGNQCGAGESCCQGECVDTRADENNCGVCGNVCDFGLSCCNSGIGSCVDLQSNDSHCGTCGNFCDQDQSCRGGICLDLD